MTETISNPPERTGASTLLLSLSLAWSVLAGLGYGLDGIFLFLGRVHPVEAGYAAICISSISFMGALCGRGAHMSHPEHSRWIRWLREPLFGLAVMFIYASCSTALAFALTYAGVERATLFLQPMLFLIFPCYVVMALVGHRARKTFSGTHSHDGES